MLFQKGCCRVILLFAFLFPLLLQASTTGKITGTVIDAETKEPLIGANVIVEDTYLGAATDLEGRYIIVNVPPGIHSLRVEMIGYRKMRITDVRVSIDLTTKQNVSMQEQILEADTELVVTAERPIIQKDMTSSMAAVGAKEIEDMPVQSIGAVINLQAGVVNHDGLHIRGGRSGEVVHWVDGLDMTTVGGGRAVSIEKDVVQELQVISGTFNAEYGRAMSGVVNVVTKDGSPEYRGSVKTYGTTRYSRFGKYYILNDYTDTYNYSTGEYESVEDRFYYYRKPHLYNYHLEGQFSGPVPFTNKRLSFISDIRLNEGLGSFGRRWFRAQGLPGDSALVRIGGGTSWSGFNKLSYNLSKAIKLKYTLFFNGYNNRRDGSTYVPESGNLSKGHGMTHMLTWNHVLSPSTFYEIKIAKNNEQSESYRYEDYKQIPNYLVRMDDPWSVLADSSIMPPDYFYEMVGDQNFKFDPDNEQGQEMLQFLQDYGFQYTWTIDPNDYEGYIHPDSNRADNVPYSLSRIGMSHGHSYSKNGFVSAKFDLSSQVTNTHFIKAGFDYKQYEQDRYNYSLIPKTVEGGNAQIVPFVPDIPEEATPNYTKFNRKPYEFSIYIQDKMEFKEIIVNMGVRYDYFHSNAVIPADPRDPDIYFPFNNDNIYRDWIEPSPDEVADWSITDWDNYKAGFEEYTPDERRSIMHQKVGGKGQLSPRLGVAFPITDKGVIHFSYGFFFQRPSFSHLYRSPDFKIGKNLRALIGNADLDAERTIQYEVGVQQQLAKTLGADITVYYKDIRGWISTSPLIQTDDIYLRYSKVVNKDFANVRGITVKLDNRFSRGFGGRLDYTYQVAEGINNAPSDAYNAIVNNQQPRNYLIPMSYDLRHKLDISLRARKWGWLASLIWSFRTGFPYTPSPPRGESIGGSAFVGWRQNSEVRPIITNTTLRLEKGFKTGSLNHLFYVYVYNLFDQKGETNVYSDTGTARYTTFLDKDNIQYDPARVGTIDYYIDRNNVGFFQSARRIEFGYSIKF